MTPVVLAVLVLLVAFFVLSVRRSDREPRPEPQPRERRVEGMPEMGMASAPDGWVTIRPSLAAEEALVARGLLDSNGIRAALESTDPLVIAQYPIRALRMRLCVAPEDAEAATALLGE
ncbi:MAG: hypothetical protein QOE45_949 [Frankiaceae bacterium]|jgi:hypothetical protein|nr:hypothetical protein [Frankiaceae bacterium]